MNAAAATNHHCTCVAIGGVGVMIEGAAGAGKTSLALGLIEAARARGLDGALVADDQALLSARGGRLMARVPGPIAGKVELRGFGICEVEHREEAMIGVVAEIAEPETIERMPEPQTCERAGVSVDLVRVPARHEALGVRIILAHLGWLDGAD